MHGTLEKSIKYVEQANQLPELKKKSIKSRRIIVKVKRKVLKRVKDTFDYIELIEKWNEKNLVN